MHVFTYQALESYMHVFIYQALESYDACVHIPSTGEL